MRKVFISVLATLFFALLLFSGCTRTEKIITAITDIGYYADMRAEADRIEVKLDNHTGKPFNFVIENKNDIDYIMNIVLNVKLKNLGSGNIAPQDNTSFVIYQGEKVYGVSLSGVTVNGRHYAFSSTELQLKIHDLAIAQGAYDTAAGVIYKIIDSADIEDADEQKITVPDSAALLSLLHSHYAGCEYFYLLDDENSSERYYTSGITVNELAAYQYKAAVKTGEGKSIVMRHIFRNYNSTSYYITQPSLSEINYGAAATCREFAFGLWHNYYLTLWYV